VGKLRVRIWGVGNELTQLEIWDSDSASKRIIHATALGATLAGAAGKWMLKGSDGHVMSSRLTSSNVERRAGASPTARGFGIARILIDMYAPSVGVHVEFAPVMKADEVAVVASAELSYVVPEEEPT